MRRILPFIFACLIVAALSSGAEAAAFPAGKVESVSGGLWVTRDNRVKNLDSNDDIYDYDIIRTDEGGAAEVRFADGSLLKMNGGASVNVMEVVFSEGRNRFNVGITRGIARVITGEIARLNPSGFKISTPKTTLGIRGTTLLFEVSEVFERVTLEELNEGSVVRLTIKETKESWTMSHPGGSITVNAPDPPGSAPTVDISGAGVFKGDLSPRDIERNRRNPGVDRKRGGGNGGGRDNRERGVRKGEGGNNQPDGVNDDGGGGDSGEDDNGGSGADSGDSDSGGNGADEDG